MAVNKRNFKKAVDAVGASIVQEMMIAFYNVEGVDRQLIGNAVGKILDATEEARKNANVTFDRGPRAFSDIKVYSKEKASFYRQLFKKISKDFSETVDLALKDFNAALPEEVKKAQKASVAE